MAAREADDRTGVIALARMSSRRLPGKALLALDGQPLLRRVLERLGRVRETRLIILATSTDTDDDRLAELAEAAGVAVYRGSLTDVAGRFLGAMEASRLDRAVRISGDSPFIDPGLIDTMTVLAHSDVGRDADLVTNVAPRSFPAGCSVEIIRRTALARACAEMTDASDREHVTSYFYRHPTRFRVVNHGAGDDRYRDVVLTVDDASDLERLDRLARVLGAEAASADLETVAAAWRVLMSDEQRCDAC